ncbi:MAG: MMPL family transporter [Rhodospirillaceae bacterium]|nr:MMPL family transporter [Rhodospirillales bacterium]
MKTPPLSLAARLVVWCWRHGGLVAVLTLALVVPAGWLAVTRLSLDTDQTRMIADRLPYGQAEQRFDRAFPQTMDRLVAVVEGATPEQSEAAAQALVHRLAGSDLFLSVGRPPSELFFRDNGLLFLPERQLEDLADRLIRAQPVLGGLAADPSLRGLLGVVSLMLMGVERGEASIADLEPVLAALAKTGDSVLAGRPRPLSWQSLIVGREGELRRFVITRPRLDDAQIIPGDDASRAIRKAAEGLDARVRLTGPVALSDDNFRTVAEGVSMTSVLSLSLVCALLLLAQGSLRLASAVLLTLLAGLAVTSAFAALAVGVQNPISVVFVALFVGLAVNFGIQFAVRFRDDLFRQCNAERAMAQCAPAITRPLTVVAAATAIGFLSFVPTDYVGMAQLGLIAGVGMVIGLAATLTLLPALLALVPPPPEQVSPGFSRLGPVEQRLRRHGTIVLVAMIVLALASAVMAPRLAFDFDPLHLQDPSAESVATLRDLADSSDTNPYVINVVAPSLAQADAMAGRLQGGPVASAQTLSSFIPERQAEKLAILDDLNQLIGESLYPAFPSPPPTAAETRRAMAQAASRLGTHPLANTLRALLDRGRTEQFERAVTAGLPGLLAMLRAGLAVEEITPASLPPDLVRDWMGTGGEARVEVHPSGDLSGKGQMAAFVASVQAVAPDVSGLPVAIVQGSAMVVDAFLQAGLYALVAVLLLLAVVLRRVGETLLVLAPLALGGLFTVAAMVALGVAVNLANIIAFPLLLGIGVAYNVYFVLNWRAGMGPLLPSATARAVLFSALTTGVAFGALALSPHGGTASMGLVLMMSLVLMVLTSFVMLPAAFAVMERWRRRP